MPSVPSFPSSDPRQYTQRYQGRLRPAVIRDTCCCLVAQDVITITGKKYLVESIDLLRQLTTSLIPRALPFRCALLTGVSDSSRGERNISGVGANTPFFSRTSSETTATGGDVLMSTPSSRSILSELSGLCASGETQSKLVGKGPCSMDCG